MEKTEATVAIFGMIIAAVFLGFIFTQISACDIQGRKIDLEKKRLLYENFGRITPTEAEIEELANPDRDFNSNIFSYRESDLLCE